MAADKITKKHASAAASSKKTSQAKGSAKKAGELPSKISSQRGKAVEGKTRAGKKASGKPETGKNDLKDIRKALIQKREAIVKEAKTEIAKYISGENRQLVDTALDDGDWAVVDISEDINLMRLGAHRKALRDIDESLRKISEGSYGICEECGEEISEKRLSVLPSATLCISCQENKEQMEAIEREE